MESKAVGFDPLLKAYGFGLRISQSFTGGLILLFRRPIMQENQHHREIFL